MWIVASGLFGLSSAQAAEPSERLRYRSLPELSNCSFYRSKKREVPVYLESNTAAEVVGRLGLGEEVCYVGEVGAFVILDWSKQWRIRGGTAPDGAQPHERGFVRLVDLWPPREQVGSPSAGWGVTDWWMRYGGTMDDPLGGLRGDP